jgi:predicted TIM-barrel fold metal-dependent hydrolase
MIDEPLGGPALADVGSVPDRPARPATVRHRGAKISAMQVFGSDRVTWGSDWPMTHLFEGYRRTAELGPGLGATGC